MTRLRNISGAAIACLMLCLSACGADRVVVKREPVPVLPPSALMQPTPEPEPDGEALIDVFRWCQTLQSALLSCNADKQSLREWRGLEDAAPRP